MTFSTANLVSKGTSGSSKGITANLYLLILIIIAKFYSVNLPRMHFAQDFIHLVQPLLFFGRLAIE